MFYRIIDSPLQQKSTLSGGLPFNNLVVQLYHRKSCVLALVTSGEPDKIMS